MAQTKKEQNTMPLGKINYVLIAACVLLIVVGFALMSGSANEGTTFNADIFSTRRIVVAPFITFLGFVLMPVAILFRGKSQPRNTDNA